MVNAKNRKTNSSSSTKDSGNHNETLSTSKSSNSNGSTSEYSCHYNADDEFCFIGSNNLDENLSYVRQKIKDVKLQREPDKKLEKRKKSPLHFIRQLSEPIYETIPELTENDDCQQWVYALPANSVKQMATNKKPSKIITSRLALEVFAKSNNWKTKSNYIVHRSATLNIYDQSEDHVDNDDVPEERAKKIKEVERLLKLSLSNNTQSSTSSNEIALKSLAFAKKKPQVHQRKRIVKPDGKMPLKGTIPRPASLVTFGTDNLEGEKHSNMISNTSMENLVKKSDEVMKGKNSKHDHQIHALKEQYQKQQEEAVLMRFRANCNDVPTIYKSLPPIFNIPPPPPLPPVLVALPLPRPPPPTTRRVRLHDPSP